MTKDLALLVGPDQKWLSTTGFLDKIDAASRIAPSSTTTPRWRKFAATLEKVCIETVRGGLHDEGSRPSGRP